MAGKPKYVVELEERLAAAEARLEALESAPAAAATPVTSVTITQDGRKVSNRMISTLVRLGDFDSFEVAHEAALKGFPVAARLDEWSACFKALGVQVIRCNFCSGGQHGSKDEARACAMESASRI